MAELDAGMVVGLQDELISELTIELQNEPDFSADMLAIKVRNAIRDVKLRRNYEATTYDDDKIEKDLYKYYSVIKAVALYDYNLIGAEGETYHSENGVNRTYADRDKLMSSVCAFVQVL